MAGRRTTRRVCRRKRRREMLYGVAAIALAGLMQPIFARMLGEFHHQAAVTLPAFVLVAFVCLICPGRLTPPLALAGIYAAELVAGVLNGSPISPGLLDELAEGRWLQLKVLPASLAVGYLAVFLRRRFRLFRRGFRTNLGILLRRPRLFARKYWLSLSILLIGASLDAATTIAFMLEAGPEDEMHPAMRAMAEVLGVWPGVVLGTAGRLAFVLMIAAVWRKWCAWMLGVCGVLYLLAAGSNHFGWLDWAWWALAGF